MVSCCNSCWKTLSRTSRILLRTRVTSAVSAALQGVYGVQIAMVQGYYPLLVRHPRCPCGIAIAVTHPQHNFMRHPSGQPFGKAALRIEQMERGCDGVAVLDQTESDGKSAEQLREMLLPCVEAAARG